MIKYFDIIHKHIPSDSEAYRFYIPHVVLVTHKALAIARRLELSESSREFIEEAGMLHDIGILQVDAPDIGCYGKLPYICHGHLGAELLHKEGLPQHAMVAERHTGVGITRQDIAEQHLPLPDREMVPLTLEEKIVCYADIWYSKHPQRLWTPYSTKQILEWFGKLPSSAQKIAQFESWQKEFEPS